MLTLEMSMAEYPDSYRVLDKQMDDYKSNYSAPQPPKGGVLGHNLKLIHKIN